MEEQSRSRRRSECQERETLDPPKPINHQVRHPETVREALPASSSLPEAVSVMLCATGLNLARASIASSASAGPRMLGLPPLPLRTHIYTHVLAHIRAQTQQPSLAAPGGSSCCIRLLLPGQRHVAIEVT